MECGLHISNQFIPFSKLPDFQIPDDHSFKEALSFSKDYILGKSRYPFETSGSTGVPKKIYLTRQQLKHSALSTGEALDLQSGYNALVCISTKHVGGKMMLVRGLELGMNLWLLEPNSSPDLDNLPEIDFVALIPLQLRSMINISWGREFLEVCKVVIVGGGQVEPALASQLDFISTPIYQTFGMTETASHIALKRLNGPDKQIAYHPLPGISFSVNANSCLIINGKITNNHPIVTNDLVELYSDGSFSWIGRYDHAINTGGYKVIPETLAPKIVNCLESLGIEEEHFIVGLPDVKWGECVVLLIEMENPGPGLKHQIMHCLKQQLRSYQVPKILKFIAKFPRTPTGKADYLSLKRMLSINL